MEIPDILPHQKRVVIAGAGFAGLTLAKKLSSKSFQVVLIDKNNYHQFQPLLYQVAAAGLEPTSIAFPLRKVFQKKKNVFIRIAEVRAVDTQNNSLQTSIGNIQYDYLVIAHGASTNFFGMSDLQQHAFPMKSVSEALLLRNTLLQNYELALTSKDPEEREALLHIIIVGGGPTGVELAGAIAELKNKILPKDYPEINFNQMKVCLVEASPRLLNGMSEGAGNRVKKYLNGLGVNVLTNTSIKNYDGHAAIINDGKVIYSRSLIWAAGVKGSLLEGLPASALLPNHRIIVDHTNRVKHLQNVFAIGDVAAMLGNEFPKGHPQVAPVAIQQASLLSRNLERLVSNKVLVPFVYKDKGSMATVGRNLAVAEAGKIKLKGFIAWIAWMMVHLMSIIGVKNRLLILINWVWQYVTYDQSLRLIIRPSEKKTKQKKYEKITDPITLHKPVVGLQ
ncbi:MAG TPA: NAD(P)/FAD-dependent oxidoreductase [Flavisolibacter sp.]